MSKQTSARLTQAEEGQVSIEARLENYPELRAKFEELLKIVENADGQIELADDAEQRVVDEIRGLGQAALKGWAQRQERKKATELSQLNPAAQKDRKKSFTGTPASER